MIKPGYRTSEFWFTLVSFVFSGLYLTGFLDNNTQKEDLIQETSKGLEAAILIIGQLTVLYKYIQGRSDIKKTLWGETDSTDKTQPPPKRKKSPPKTKKTKTS